MKLEYLCDVKWRYERMHSVPPSASREGLMYGRGQAEFRGRLAGTADWSNFPRFRSGFAFPDARGALPLESGALVLFTVTGVSSLTDGAGMHVMRFVTDDESEAWLNEVFALGEGSVDAERGVLEMTYYRCEPERSEGATPRMS